MLTILKRCINVCGRRKGIKIMYTRFSIYFIGKFQVFVRYDVENNIATDSCKNSCEIKINQVKKCLFLK